MKKHFLLLAISLLTLQVGHSQTNVSGSIFSNTTWTVAGSPYIVTDNIIIMDSVTLTIQPGVIVKFDIAKLLFIEVRGSLKAMGTITDSILFTTNTAFPNQFDWDGIKITKSADSVNLNFCKFEYSWTAILQGNGIAGLKICKNSTFVNNHIGIAGYSDMNIHVDSCYFESNAMAIDQVYSINSCTFINNSIGISTVNSIRNSTVCGQILTGIGRVINTVANCTITNNDIGIGAVSADTIINNFVYNNRIGLQFYSCSFTPYIANNSICGNTEYNIVNYCSDTLTAINNCWCDTDSTNIATKIYDGSDVTGYGLVHYSPYINCDTSILPSTAPCAPLPTGIINRKFSNSNDFRIYPNPFSEYAILEFTNPKNEICNLSVYNVFGQLLLTIGNITTGQVNIERTNLAVGLYLFQMRTDRQVIVTGKFIIE